MQELLGITDNLLDRFPRNTLIKVQALMFLIGAFYLLVRIPFSKRFAKRDRNASREPSKRP